MSQFPRRALLTAILLVPFTADSACAQWHHPFCLDGGGWWRQRIKVVVHNERSSPVAGEPVALTVGTRPGEADLTGQSARAVRVVNEQGQEMLYSIVMPSRDRVTDGPISLGSTLWIPAECPDGKSAVYYVYFDNPAAWEVPDFLGIRTSATAEKERGRGDSRGLTATAEMPERLELQEVGAKARWPEEAAGTAQGSRRLSVDVIHLSPREQPQALVCVPVGALRTRMAVPDGTFTAFDADRKIPSRLLGDLLLFQTSLSGRSRQPCYVCAAAPGDSQATLPILSEAQNLVRNPGFEQGDALPDHWTHDPTDSKTGVKFSIDRPDKSDLGRNCVKMQVPATAPQTWRGWHQTVRVVPGHTYLIAASVKCQDVQGGEVRVHLHLYGADGKLSKHEPMQSIGPGISGSADWTVMTGLLTTPEDAAEVQFHLTMQGSGTVWHDNLVLAEVTLGTLGRLEGRPLGPSEVKAWPVAAVIKVFEDDPAPQGVQDDAKGPPAARITAARREREPLQVALRSGRAMPRVRVEVAPPVGPGGAKLEDLEICTVGYVPIDHPTNYYQSSTLR